MRYTFRHIPLLGLIAAGTISADVISIPIAKRDVFTEPLSQLIRRGDSLGLDALNNITGGGYYATLGIGTPPQNISFQLDTGSSDTWVHSVNSSFCKSRSKQLANGFCMKQFDSSRSNSFSEVSRGDFEISYLDGHDSQGDYFKDTVIVNGATVKDQQLGLALKSSRPTGIMGLGFKETVAAKTKYPTIVDNMVSQKLIQMPAFSLYLNDLDSNQGTILFGGVDTEKFTDGLATLPLKSPPSPGQDLITYAVQLEGFSASAVATSSISPVALLDSGSTISLLPDIVVRTIWDHYGVKVERQTALPLVDCAKANADDTFSFKFDGKTIKVPIREMVLNSFAKIQNQLKSDVFAGWQGVCLFGISSLSAFGDSSSNVALLGDTFLRSAYVVYDMSNKQIGIAQAKVNTTSSNIVEFQAGAKTIPGPASKGNSGSTLTPSSNLLFASTLIVTVATLMSSL